jgi:MFS family permease
MVALLTGHARRLSFGLITAFASSFGQTFFIALSVPYLLAELALGEGRFGLIYAAATLTGGLTLPVVGRLIDRFPLRHYTTATLATLAVAAAVLAWSPHVAALVVALVGLRLAGQGLLGHISQTTMARDFDQDRGKALGIAGLGFPLGEAALPAVFLLCVATFGWRAAWIGVALAVGVVLIPLCWWLAGRQSDTLSAVQGADHPTRVDHLTTRDLLADPRFRLVLPAVVVTPLLLTALFLYQAVLGQSKGWSPAWLATAFMIYAASRASASLLVGPLIDRWSARALLPVYLIPLGGGLAVLSLGSSPWLAPLYLGLVGLTTGASGSVMSALWAEMYGPSQVASVRSVTTGLVIVSTAVSPAVFGVLLERGLGFDAIQYGGLVLILASAALGWLAVRREQWQVRHDQPLRRVA